MLLYLTVLPIPAPSYIVRKIRPLSDLPDKLLCKSRKKRK